MPELQTLVTWANLQYNLRPVQNFVGDAMDKNYDVIVFISRRFRVVNFADIINIATMFIKITFKNSKKKIKI